MSLQFFADVDLTLPLTVSSPKRFLWPSLGGKQLSRVWLGDPYTSTFSVAADIADSTVFLTDTGEFLDATAISGTSGGVGTAVAIVNGSPLQFTYTGKTQDSLTGVVGISEHINVNSVVYPYLVYKSVAPNLSVVPIGADIITFGIRVAVGTNQILNFPGLPANYIISQIPIGVANAVEVFMSAAAPAGADQEFTHFGVQANNLYIRDFQDTTAVTDTEATLAPVANCYGYRHDQYLTMSIRTLPTNRQVAATSPGYIVGQYRWRDNTRSNATALVPTTWANTPTQVGLEKFIGGIGDQNDLAPIKLEEADNSVHMDVEKGQYFTGANRYYLPADPSLEFFPTGPASANPDSTVTIVLQNEPRPLPEAPIFCGTYSQDSEGFYENDQIFEYIGTTKNPDGSHRTDLPANYFTLDRPTKTLTLNTDMKNQILFLGVVSGQSVDFFNIPIYPVDQILTVYVDRGPSAPPLYAAIWTYNQSLGTIQVPNIAGSLQGQGVFAIASPAVAVLYDKGPDNDREITTIDFNPAFSGLAGGYFYLQHRIQTPSELVLSADKPRIDIPPTQASIVGLVAYGPVYFENDFALLTVTAFGPLNHEIIPNAKLDVVVDPETFTGTINYVDPLSTTVSVITGGDGTANLIFIPKSGFGVYVPTIAATGGLGGVATTHILHDTLVLPADIPLSQLWNVQEGWLVTTYSVIDNDPLFGMVGADPSLGEIPWQTQGTPGGTDYKTNGERDAWYTGVGTFGNLVVPIDAQDVHGNSYTSSSFDGNVRRLIYPQALPNGGSLNNVGAYFITFIQRVLIRMRLEGSDLFSNYILLQMQNPTLIFENPWLILNDQVQGLLNQFRLGFVPGLR